MCYRLYTNERVYDNEIFDGQMGDLKDRLQQQ